MGTIMEYLHWRGDLTFNQDPFNDIDALILSMLSYLSYKDIVPGIDSNNSVSLRETSTQYFAKTLIKETKSSNVNPTASHALDSELLELLKETAACPRFENIHLSRYDEKHGFYSWAAVWCVNLHSTE